MPALLGAPYANAPSWCFLFTELSMYALMMVSVIHAFRRRDGSLAWLLGGTAFGFLVEYFEVITGSYTYGRFSLMLGHAPLDIPLFVGFAWGMIMYTARLFSDAAGLPMLAAAALDTLLALNIDLSIDVTAYRMHFWNWDWNGSGRNPLTADWFGIPYGNFVGWITVVFCYSIFSRLLERWLLRKRRTAVRVWSIPALSTVLSLGVLFATEMFLFPVLNHIGFRSGPRLIALTILLLVGSFRGWTRRVPSARKMHPLAQWVPGWFHIFFMYCFFALGFYRENKWMTIATCLNFVIGVAIHSLPACLRSADRIPETASVLPSRASGIQPVLVGESQSA